MMLKPARNLILMLVMVLAVCHPAQTQEYLSARQKEILQEVGRVDGYVTEKMHAEFWAESPNATFKDEAEKEAFFVFIERLATRGALFKRELWSSVKASMDAGRIVKTPGYEAAKAAALEALDGRPGLQKQAMVEIAQNEKLFEAAAKGLPIESAEGPVYLTPEKVDAIRADLDGVVARARKLANPVWKTELVEHSFPEAHVKILWDGVFAREVQNSQSGSGEKIRRVSLSYQVSEFENVRLSYLQLEEGLTNPAEETIAFVRNSLRGAGIDHPTKVSGVLWRGRHSAIGNGMASFSGGKLAASVRVLQLEEYNGILLIIGTTATSVLDAKLLRERLEERLQILR